MKTQKMKKDDLDEKILSLKKEILNLGPMRPGSLSVQYRNRAEKIGPFYQLSYTLQRKSHSESVRIEDLSRIEQETENFRTFKRLCDELILLSLERSKGLRK